MKNYRLECMRPDEFQNDWGIAEQEDAIYMVTVSSEEEAEYIVNGSKMIRKCIGCNTRLEFRLIRYFGFEELDNGSGERND